MATVRTRPERLSTGALLAAVGGFLDAYTFVGHGGVFANAQTGNIVLLGVDTAARRWHAALLHVPPLLAFLIAVAAAETLARPPARRVVRRPTRVVLGVEIVVLAALAAAGGTVPGEVATAAVAFVAALQVSTFRSLQDVSYSTTLTTGNLRSLVESAYRWRADRDLPARKQTGRLAAVIVSFAGGAATGALCTRLFGLRAVLLAAAALVVVLGAIVAETAALERRP